MSLPLSPRDSSVPIADGSSTRGGTSNRANRRQGEKIRNAGNQGHSRTLRRLSPKEISTRAQQSLNQVYDPKTDQSIDPGEERAKPQTAEPAPSLATVTVNTLAEWVQLGSIVQNLKGFLTRFPWPQGSAAMYYEDTFNAEPGDTFKTDAPRGSPRYLIELAQHLGFEVILNDAAKAKDTLDGVVVLIPDCWHTDEALQRKYGRLVHDTLRASDSIYAEHTGYCKRADEGGPTLITSGTCKFIDHAVPKEIRKMATDLMQRLVPILNSVHLNPPAGKTFALLDLAEYTQSKMPFLKKNLDDENWELLTQWAVDWNTYEAAIDASTPVRDPVMLQSIRDDFDREGTAFVLIGNAHWNGVGRPLIETQPVIEIRGCPPEQ
ncbi:MULTISPECIES: hypothetical protein [unclassified Variovorax]|uniref:hypothetical protein n=1 Tax=unclassified Variovorax TaxID=663243 RepID=UPI0011AF27E2|nr:MULTISPECIES: hypothetical protein [unclassified Variovorax]